MDVDRLSVEFVSAEGAVCAVDQVSLTIGRGEIVGLAGESGSGKSTLARALLRVLGPPAVITGGHVRMGGIDVLDLDEPALRAFRWAKVAMVYQSAMDALSPVLTIGAQLEDSILAHKSLSRAELDREVSELLSLVGIDPGRRSAYPHALSGGMRQRGGLAQKRFPWGDDLEPEGKHRMNVWQGVFPNVNTEADGHFGPAPAKSYRANGYGLYNMTGNVWEWCWDWFDPGWYRTSPRFDPTGPAGGERRVMRGGSYLCHASYCNRYRTDARSSNTPDSATTNLGFRCVRDG